MEMQNAYQLVSDLEQKNAMRYSLPVMLALDEARAAMKKQIPVLTEGKHTDFRCGACGGRVRSGNGSSQRTRDRYCQKCGQKLAWADEIATKV